MTGFEPATSCSQSTPSTADLHPDYGANVQYSLALYSVFNELQNPIFGFFNPPYIGRVHGVSHLVRLLKACCKHFKEVFPFWLEWMDSNHRSARVKV